MSNRPEVKVHRPKPYMGIVGYDIATGEHISMYGRVREVRDGVAYGDGFSFRVPHGVDFRPGDGVDLHIVRYP